MRLMLSFLNPEREGITTRFRSDTGPLDTIDSNRTIRNRISSEDRISIRFLKKWRRLLDSEILRKFLKNPMVKDIGALNIEDLEFSGGGLSISARVIKKVINGRPRILRRYFQDT